MYSLAQNYSRGSKYNSWSLQYSVVVGLYRGWRAEYGREERLSVKWGPASGLHVANYLLESYVRSPARTVVVVLTQDAMLSSSPPGNPQDVSCWKRHYTSTHSTTQHYLQSLSRHRSVNLSHSTVRSTLKALTGSLDSLHLRNTTAFSPPHHHTRLRVQSLPTTLHCTALTYHHITASASLSTTVCDRVIPHNLHRLTTSSYFDN